MPPSRPVTSFCSTAGTPAARTAISSDRPSFANVPNESDLAQNEVFGPVASTEAWTDEQDAIRTANDTIFGLAAGIWSRDVANAMRVADRIEAGTVYINNYFNAAAQSPVGGYKQSGYGRENGWEGMRCFMQTKSVWLSTDPSQPAPFRAHVMLHQGPEFRMVGRREARNTCIFPPRYRRPRYRST